MLSVIIFRVQATYYINCDPNYAYFFRLNLISILSITSFKLLNVRQDTISLVVVLNYKAYKAYLYIQGIFKVKNCLFGTFPKNFSQEATSLEYFYKYVLAAEPPIAACGASEDLT